MSKGLSIYPTILVAAMMISSPAQAMNFANIDDVAKRVTNGSYTGVGTVNIMYASSRNVDDSGTCTGTLIAANVVITAAHCFDNEASDPIVGLIFDLPSYGERSTGTTFYALADSWTQNPDYVKNSGDGYDIALFTLTTAATGHEVYGFYEEDPIGKEYTRVGTGLVGGEAGTGTGGVRQDYKQRAGNNIYEYFAADLLERSAEQLLWSDFDDGTATHDVFGRTTGKQQTGVDGEHTPAPADSGAATFIDGKIVGITKGGVSGTILDQDSCGNPTDIDPYMTSYNACTNASVGEIINDSWAQGSMGFINNYLAAVSAVPEPSTWLMMCMGFLASAIGLRRSRPAAPVAARAPTRG